MINRSEFLDRDVCFILRAMWAFLTYAAFCVMCFVFLMYAEPGFALGMYHMVPKMVECLLAGCVVTVGFGTAFQYLGGK